MDPILAIETGMHTAVIRKIGVDGACSLLATGSEDKTVRLWSLPEGRLLRTLRWPIGPGNGGKVYATALSPDGSLVAVGGWDARSGHSANELRVSASRSRCRNSVGLNAVGSIRPAGRYGIFN
jgi:WD40 repeat protein